MAGIIAGYIDKIHEHIGSVVQVFKQQPCALGHTVHARPLVSLTAALLPPPPQRHPKSPKERSRLVAATLTLWHGGELAPASPAAGAADEVGLQAAMIRVIGFDEALTEWPCWLCRRRCW